MQCLRLLCSPAPRSPGLDSGLAAVMLHDQRLIERRNFDLIASRQVEYLPAERTGVDRHPVRRTPRLQYFTIIREIGATPTSRPHDDDIAGFDEERGNVGLAIVHHEMSVAHQ